MARKAEGETLEDYLNNKVFAGEKGVEVQPEPEVVQGFNDFIKLYKDGLAIERAAIDSLPL